MEANKILILFMVRNEGRIIERAMRAAASVIGPAAAAFILADTGSTDDTVAKATATAASLGLPIHVATSTWQNFGHNRTLSYKAAQEYTAEAGLDPSTTYALALDGDMVLSGSLPQAPLTAPGYQLIQRAGSLEYVNTRLLRLDVPWRCVGATHEYWDGPQIHPLQPPTLWIDDRNDGGCKADKFERDERLLLSDLATDPSNARTHFYLAQTYDCLGRLDDAIAWYKKRIALGGWYEEIWYSMYKLVGLYLKKDEPEEAELWAARAHKFRPYRAEHFYALCRYYREKSSYWKAAHYYHVGKAVSRPQVALFLEDPVYDHLFDFEWTIIAYYISRQPEDGAIQAVRYVNRGPAASSQHTVWSNFEFYVEPPADVRIEPVTAALGPAPLPFRPSSCSYPPGKPHELNIRYVNYTIDPTGNYVFDDPAGVCRTRNYCVARQAFMPDRVDGLPSVGTPVLGLEDVRLFTVNANSPTLHFTATTREHAPVPRVLLGKYNADTLAYEDVRVLEPPGPTPCEKNWAPVDGAPEPTFVYKWHPLQIGTVPNSSSQLQIMAEHSTPAIFAHMRGSTPVYRTVAGDLWTITHLTKYSSPRKYYHCVVFLDPSTYKVKRYSLPFVFERRQIEYCLAAHISDGELHAVFSRNDSSPAWAHIPLSSLLFMEA